MKRIIYIFFVFLFFSCENKPKKKDNSKEKTEQLKKSKNEERVLSEVLIPELSNWDNNGIVIVEANEFFQGEQAILLSREDPLKLAFSAIKNLKIQQGSTYRVSVIVKKSSIGKDFGLRILDTYPNRVDAIFDLSSGTVKEPKITGEKQFAENPKATIESLGEGWYKCSLFSDLYVDYIRIVLGPTKGNLNTSLWETRTREKSEVFLIKSMLKLQEY